METRGCLKLVELLYTNIPLSIIHSSYGQSWDSLESPKVEIMSCVENDSITTYITVCVKGLP